MATGFAAGGLMMARDDIKWYMDRRAQKRAARNQWQHQKRVLKNQIQWRVRDAEKAGIHPLAALGISPAGAGGNAFRSVFEGSGVGERTIARAVEGIPTSEERALGKVDKQIKDQVLQKMQLDNQLLGIEVEKQRSVGAISSQAGGDPVVDMLNNQGMANVGNTSGSVVDDMVQMRPKQVTYSGKEGLEAGVEPFEKVKRDWEGYAWVVPSDSQDVEENAYIKAIYYASRGKKWAKSAIANKMEEFKKFLGPAGPGRVWVFRRSRGQFQSVPREGYQKEILERMKRSPRRKEEWRGKQRWYRR